MASTLFLQSLKHIPVPLFGTAATASILGQRYAASLIRLSKLAIPLGAGALWFVWPAIDDNWKQSIGLGPSKPPAAPAAPAKVELSKAALKKIETAYIPHGEELTEEEQATMVAISKGDFSSLEQDWDKFIVKVMVPGDGDDDEEEEEESEEEAEEGEEEQEEEDAEEEPEEEE